MRAAGPPGAIAFVASDLSAGASGTIITFDGGADNRERIFRDRDETWT